MYNFQNELLDPNAYEIIIHCYIKKKNLSRAEIYVTYENGSKERIWTFNPSRYVFDNLDFIGMTKIEAVFYCDRKLPQLAK